MSKVSSIQEQNTQEFSITSREDISLKVLHNLFIKYKRYAIGTAQATIKSYCYHFQLLLKFKPDIELEDLTEEMIVNFFEFLNTRKRSVGKEYINRIYKNSSIATVRGKLNAFFKWLIERGYLKASPFDKIRYPEVSYTDRRAFTLKEFEAICIAVNFKIKWQSLLIKKRNVAIIMFLVYSGVRKEELLGLTLNDIDFDRKIITIRAETSKSKLTRYIPMNRELVPHLTDYLNYRIRITCKYLWIAGTHDRELTEHGLKHFIKLLNKVTSFHCHAHRFRHTFATNYYKLTHDIVGLKKLMGHKSLKMTLTYLRSLPDEHLVEQIKKITIKEFM